jgi:hypothetical protein
MLPRVPTCIAYVPLNVVRNHARGFRCEPAAFTNGSAVPRRDYAKFFGNQGMKLLEAIDWKDMDVDERRAASVNRND